MTWTAGWGAILVPIGFYFLIVKGSQGRLPLAMGSAMATAGIQMLWFSLRDQLKRDLG